MKLATPHWQNAGNATANVQHERWQPPYRERIANVPVHFTGRNTGRETARLLAGAAGPVPAIERICSHLPECPRKKGEGEGESYSDRRVTARRAGAHAPGLAT